MYNPISLFIGLRYLWNIHLPKFKKIITFLSIIGISISTASLIIVISIINGSEENFKKNTLSFIPHLIITNQNKYINTSEFPKNILEVNNVKNFSELIKKEVIAKSENNITIAEIIGIDIKNLENIKNYNIKKIKNITQSGKHNAIIGKKLAQKLNINIGDKIKLILLSNQKDFFLGKIFNQCTFKVIDTFFTNNEIDYYQILINKKDSLNFLKYSKNYITGWRIWLKNPLSLDADLIKKSINNLIFLDWRLQKGELFKEMKIEKYIMLFLFFLILLVSILNIFITITICTVEKKNSIAILQTLGLQNWKIMLIFVVLGSGTAIVGNIFGTIISITLIIQNDFLKFFINAFFNQIDVPIIINLSQIFFINFISILLAIFSTLYPAWNSIHLKPAKILSNE